MNQADFLTILRESLEGNIPQAELEDNLRYYREYFEQSDISDREVCEELGDPRLIAKSLIDAYLASKGAEAEAYTSKARSEYSQSHGGYSNEYDGYQQHAAGSRLLQIVLIGAGILLLFAVLAIVLRLALVVLIPVLLIVLLWKLIWGD